MKASTCVALALSVVACGGGGDSGPATTSSLPSSTSSQTATAATTTTTTPPQSYVIDYYGDSTVWGLDPAKTTSTNVVQLAAPPTQVLQAALTQKCGFPVTVNNRAVPGARLLDAVNGTSPYYSTPFATAIASSPANMVIENYGINDARLNTTTGNFASALISMSQAARAAGKTMVIETPNPVVDGAQTAIYVGENAYIATLSAQAIRVAQSEGDLLVDQYDYFMTIGGDMLTEFSDGVHPTATTAALKAQRVAAAIQPLVCP